MDGETRKFFHIAPLRSPKTWESSYIQHMIYFKFFGIEPSSKLQKMMRFYQYKFQLPIELTTLAPLFYISARPSWWSYTVILVILDAEIVNYTCKLGTNVGRVD